MAASIWIRCFQLLPYLQEAGITCTVNEPDTDAQIVAFVRFQDQTAYRMATQYKAQGKKILFDLCVNYFGDSVAFERGYGISPERTEEAARMVACCDVVTCASQTIAERVRQEHSWVEYLSDSFDPRHFASVKAFEDFERPTLRAIWSGSANKAYELEPILPLLRKKRIELTLITDQPPRLRYPWILWKRAFPYRFFRWRYETFPHDILQGEICLSYREIEHSYNQGHSLFKVGVFLAQGVPVIASPVPSYLEAIEATGAGTICASLQEWEQAFDMVLEDRQMVKNWSRQARHILDAYSTPVIAQNYIRLFQQLVD